MHLPVMPPVKPMLSKSGTLDQALAVMEDRHGFVEPKWDGFRCIVFRDGDEVELGSRNERPMSRYFPEVVEAVKRELPERCVVDGELVVAGPQGLDFDALQLRLHPAASRVTKLAAETPASLVLFDILALGNRDVRTVAFGERRELLCDVLAGVRPPVHVTPATSDRDVAQDWFRRFEGAGLDGVIAKRPDLPYCEDQRVMLKVKHERTADCVVAGFRWHKTGPIVGSLVLGLYDEQGVFHHVGVTASFTMARRRELVDELAPYRIEGDVFTGRAPGDVRSRWNATKDLSFEPLRPELVCEVAYDHLQGPYRFRHAARFRRWRPDRDPRSCTYDQLEVVPPEELAAVFGAG
ncbi:MAG TPA: ATP-dependent DNA ligase [Acidimicrobiales bacterium]|nr:ATP-dependent DNA ligase [Acidimicrobiales bacterium]